MVTEVGGKPVNRRTANTLLFGEAVSHLSGAAMARLSPERGRDRVGRLGQTEREKNDLANSKEKSCHFSETVPEITTCSCWR